MHISGGTYPGFGDGQDQPVVYPGQPGDGDCCPPEVSAGQPYPIPGNQQTGGGVLSMRPGSNGQGIPTDVWRNATHTRWTVRICNQIPVLGLTGQACGDLGAVPGAGFSGQNLRIIIIIIKAFIKRHLSRQPILRRNDNQHLYSPFC